MNNNDAVSPTPTPVATEKFPDLSWSLYYSAGVAITKYNRLHGFNKTNLFSHGFGMRKFKIKVEQGSVSSEGVFLS